MTVWAGLRFRPLDAGDDDSTIGSRRSMGSIPSSTRKAPARGVSKMRVEEEEEEEEEEEPKKKSSGSVKKELPQKKRYDEDDEEDYDQGLASPSKMSVSGRKPASRRG